MINKQLTEVAYEEQNNMVKLLGLIPITTELLVTIASAIAIAGSQEAIKLLTGESALLDDNESSSNSNSTKLL